MYFTIDRHLLSVRTFYSLLSLTKEPQNQFSLKDMYMPLVTYQNFNFLTSQPKHMFWVLTKTYVKLMCKEIYSEEKV